LCAPCAAATRRFGDEALADLRPIRVGRVDEVDSELDGIKRLRRVFSVDDFAQPLDFTKKVGELAEDEGHHPALLTEWGRTTVT
jgi:4a-hydroxytetrahydrobiopterin dehydratase